MDLFRDYLFGERKEILDNDISLRAIGGIDRLFDFVRESFDVLVADSCYGMVMDLSLVLSYGGWEELMRVVQRIAVRVAVGELESLDISEDMIGHEFGLVDADLVIWISGEFRFSNFFLW